jgi:trehalose monomycolate/heme transporter
MFERWGRFVVRARWWVLVAALAVVVTGAVWGTGVFNSLTGGGFYDNHNSSARTRAQVTQLLGAQDSDVIALYSSPDLTVDDPAFQAAVTPALRRVAANPDVAAVVSWYDTQAPQLVSTDRHATYAVVRLKDSGQDSAMPSFRDMKDDFTAAAPVRTQLGGVLPFYEESNAQTAKDIARAETFSLPILAVLLVLVFGSAVAATTPLAVGGVAVLGAFIVTRVLASVTDVSTFAINIITLIGLGLSIDYALFMVSRFREELAAGRTPAEAVPRTMATAGRTVAVSGVTVTLALASLLLFPQGFLKSMGYGGMAAVAVAMLASLTALPAGLAVLGPRINAGHIPLPRRRRAAGPAEAGGEHGAWARLAHSVMRRPWWYLVGVLLILLVLAAPVTGIRFGGVDVRVLPPSATSRMVTEELQTRFPPTTEYPVQVLATGVTEANLPAVVAGLDALAHVDGATVAASKGSAALIDLGYAGDATDATARQVVREARAFQPPPGVTIGVTGYTADLNEQLSSLGSRLPWMALFVVVVTMVLLFLAFGSVLLPIKAVLMNVVSLGAAFGVVVVVFQHGHGASWLGFTTTGTIEPTDPILMVAVLFGLATDYEVFLLSRIREEYDATGDNTRAVATGLQRTGRLITSAALLLIVVVVGFATGRIAFVKLIGVGMIVAIVVDATLVRALLVPATMRLLGHWNWWAPGPLARVYRRYGLHESSVPTPAPPVGDAAPAPDASRTPDAGASPTPEISSPGSAEAGRSAR